uniref:MFS domain-containing protein n=1 Tax=Caenorhabditis tropicalis TaxID=1561998 RepID=A0A1I7TYD7_9PELO
MSDDDESRVIQVRPTFAKKRKEKKEVVFYTNFEEVLQKVNAFGPYQIFCFIVILYASIEWAGNSTFMHVLGSFEPDWNCTLANNHTMTIKAPTNDNSCAFIKKNCTNLSPIKENLEFFSIVGQFKLICDDGDKVEWIEVIMAGSSLIGSIIGGHMGDHFGRQTIFFTGELLIIITSMMCTAAQSWVAFAAIQGVNCFIYGVIETTSLTMMVEFTSNKYRVIMVNAFQWPIAYMTIALIAFLTKGWQVYFVFLNLVSSPLAIGFMLFLESPRWLIARNELSQACDVLNDIAHQRWNNTKARFTTKDISAIHKTEKQGFYWFYHLFSTRRLAKQSCLQIISVLTYAMVSNTYLFTVSGLHDSAIMFTFLDGVFRLFVPIIIVIFDLMVPSFGRKIQFLGSLIIEGILFGVVIALVATGTCTYDSRAVTILVIVTTMINDCIFWINIVQITTQRYPTVVRCIAFGFLHSFRHIGAIIGFLILKPLLTSNWPTGAFVIPEAMIVLTIFVGFFFQPETKGKALMDQMVEANYGRLENELPRALMRLAAGHRVDQSEMRQQHRKDMEQAKAAELMGQKVESPWVFKQKEDGESPIKNKIRNNYSIFFLHGFSEFIEILQVM